MLAAVDTAEAFDLTADAPAGVDAAAAATRDDSLLGAGVAPPESANTHILKSVLSEQTSDIHIYARI